jgi:hypothetical protein
MLASYHRILEKFAADFAGDRDLVDPHRRAAARGLAPTRHAAFSRRILMELVMAGRSRPIDYLWLAVTVGGRPLYNALRLLRALLRRAA